MASAFSAVKDDFDEELAAIRSLVEAFADHSTGTGKARVAAANAATLLLAATFEEFIREMARTHARSVVAACSSIEELPSKLVATAWKRTMDTIGLLNIGPSEARSSEALAKFNVAYDFCVRGDLSQDVYEHLIHNDNNMRPNEINAMFRIGGLSNICNIVCNFSDIKDFAGQQEVGKANAYLVRYIEDFMGRRNQTAHSINAMRSSGSDQILKDIEFLGVFGSSLVRALEAEAPQPKPLHESP